MMAAVEMAWSRAVCRMRGHLWHQLSPAIFGPTTLRVCIRCTLVDNRP